ENGLPPKVESAFVRRAGDGHGPPGTVEPHRNLPGVPAHDEELWDAFSADTEPLTVAGVEVRVLGRTALALHVVIHAVQHAFTLHTAEDLRRAVAVMAADDWRAVAVLARRLGVEDIVGYGLRHTEAGAVIADGLGLPTMVAGSSAFWYVSAPRGSVSMAECWAAPTWSLKLKWVRWTLVPSRAKIRYLYGVVNPSPSALASAYLRRWRDVACSLGAAARSAAAHRRSIRDMSDRG
ncbi:MAG: nucleotidyltransferase family protein, partial [Acidimicrobiales bacterium]